MSGGTRTTEDSEGLTGNYMERKLKNGKEYRFEEIFKGYITTYCLYDGKWNHITASFHSWEEVDKWCEKLDYDFEHPKVWKPADVPADYYDDTTRYYGD
jgi:hypothetical protein